MKTNSAIQWTRLTAEAVAIVASILLAFAIDAWWEERQERALEQLALSRLTVEFHQNLRQLQFTRERHTESLHATNQLLALTGPEGNRSLDMETVAPLLIRCLTNTTFDPRMGTLESLIASGNLQLLSDLELQSMLTEWPTAMMNMLEWQRIERINTEQILLPFTYDYVSYPNVIAALQPGDEKYQEGALQSGRFDSDLNTLFSSMRFEGMLTNRRVNIRQLVDSAQALEQSAADILAKLEQQTQ